MNESKKKNILIGGLLAIVLVMAVGYAAFATQLQINGSANIDTTWNVHFVNNPAGSQATPATADVTDILDITAAGTGTPSGYLTFDTPGLLTANIGATLKQPGDTEEFTLTIINEGSFNATLDSIVIAWEDSQTQGTIVQPTSSAAGTAQVTGGHIKFEVTSPQASLPNSGTNTTDMTVTATYVAGAVTSSDNAQESTPAITGNVTDATESAAITVTMVYKQASA